MSAEIESLSTDLKSRRQGQGVSPMLVTLVVLGLLLAVYAHWRFGQFDERIDPVYGARPLKRFLQSHVETLVARRIIAADVAPGETMLVDVDPNGNLIVT